MDKNIILNDIASNNDLVLWFAPSAKNVKSFANFIFCRHCAGVDGGAESAGAKELWIAAEKGYRIATSIHKSIAVNVKYCERGRCDGCGSDITTK